MLPGRWAEMALPSRCPGGGPRGRPPGLNDAPRAGRMWGEIPAISCPARTVSRQTAPPPEGATPLGRGARPRATRPHATRARDFNASEGWCRVPR